MKKKINRKDAVEPRRREEREVLNDSKKTVFESRKYLGELCAFAVNISRLGGEVLPPWR
jgi:hypothetical protein